jgi:hypothetical protein
MNLQDSLWGDGVGRVQVVPTMATGLPSTAAESLKYWTEY